MFVLTALAPSVLWPAYFALLLVIIWILFRDSAWRHSIAIVGLFLIGLMAVYQGQIQTLATEDYYRTRGYDNPDIVFSGNSFYHSLDVIDTFDDEQQTELESRVSFLNGVRYFRFYYDDGQFAEESRLSEFSYYLAELPARYLSELLERPLRVLIMGAGSMYSIRRTSPYASAITMVEIDPMVVEAAKTCWSDINQLDTIANYEVVFDDVKHFLRTTDERFDLIINDISAPYYLGTALLHSREFFELVRSRLEEDGLFSEALQGRPYPNSHDSTPMKIIRGVADVFPVFRVVETRRDDGRRGNQGFIYATSDLEITTDGLTAIMRDDNQYDGTSTFWQRSDNFVLHRTNAYSLNNMETLVRGNVGRLKGRLRFDDDEEPDRLGLGAFFGKMFDTDDSEHSRLLVTMVRSLAKPVIFGQAIGVALIALLLGLLPRLRRSRSVAEE